MGMRRIIGVLVSDHIAAGVVSNHEITGSLCSFPAEASGGEMLQTMPVERIGREIAGLVERLAAGEAVDAVGVGFPGLTRNGVIEEAPNLHQFKGYGLEAALRRSGRPMFVFNNADAMAAGIAATRGQLDRLIRVWVLGDGIGYGRYPWTEGVWEGGHCVVTLDPKEKYCRCGGVGHLEGIMGHRAMRLRFLDREPEEIFSGAMAGDERCAEFVRLWHRALAAGTATSIHLDGPGRFFLSGANARFVDLPLVNRYLAEMVQMSPLQGSAFELIPTSDETGIIGAAVNAGRAAG